MHDDELDYEISANIFFEKAALQLSFRQAKGLA